MRNNLKKIDIPLLLIVLILTTFGLVMIYSSSSITAVVRYGLQPYFFFKRQLLFVIPTIIASFIFVLNFPTKHYKRIIIFPLIILFAALIYLISNNDVINNAKSWISVMGIHIQPSEFAKSIIIIFFASFFGENPRYKTNNLSRYFIPLGVAIAIIGLVVIQPDLGSAAIIAGITFLVFISVPEIVKNKKTILKVFGIALIIGMFSLMFFGNKIINKMQSSRFNFTNPCSRYTESTGYQVCNGFIAINNGGLFGLGLGNSTQKYLYLPESHTDFIFPIIIEETGLLIGILIIVMYGYMLSRILKIAKNSENLRCSILAYGTFWYLTLHIIVNLMGVLALIPLTGVPLPFLSYGGSFVFNALLMIFIVERVNIENKINKTKRELKSL